MKNIHVLPTDKPSKKGDIVVWNGLKIWDGIGKPPHHNQNIYITNDEEPKDGDWVFDIFKNSCPVIRQLKTEEEILNVQKTEFKIILTDNEDLIKDGVQAIEDGFLEWFVKNPSCEKIEIIKVCSTGRKCDGKGKNCNMVKLKIIIPKEEPNPFELPKTLPDDVFYKSLESKQESIEKAADIMSVDTAKVHPADSYIFKQGFLEGAKWQQEQDKNKYSEEDMMKAVKFGELYKSESSKSLFEKRGTTPTEVLKKWFEQIKKK
jgi:hypothetical protein